MQHIVHTSHRNQGASFATSRKESDVRNNTGKIVFRVRIEYINAVVTLGQLRLGSSFIVSFHSGPDPRDFSRVRAHELLRRLARMIRQPFTKAIGYSTK